MIIEAKKKALLAAEIALEKKAEELVVLDMRKVTNFCDFFVFCSASSQRRAVAVADEIEEAFRGKGVRIRSCAGREDSDWILLDFSDVVIHIFLKEARHFYALDRLWSDAKRVHVPQS